MNETSQGSWRKGTLNKKYLLLIFLFWSFLVKVKHVMRKKIWYED